MATGNSPARTMESGLPRRTPSGCSSSSSDCTRARRIRVPASALRCAVRSWTSTVAKSGSIHRTTADRAPQSGGRYPPPINTERARSNKRRIPGSTGPGAAQERRHMFADDSGLMIQILLVEDDPGDVLITREAFAENKLRNVLNVVTDGESAMSFLRHEGEFTAAPRPDLILLDLNLPRKSGHEVLEEIKTDVSLQRIPVVVLTTSDAEEDILRSYNLHANAYVTKPVDFKRFLTVVRQIDEFFVTVVRLPPA